MLQVSFLLTEEIQDVNQLYRHLSVINTEGFQVQLLLLQAKKLPATDIQLLQKLEGMTVEELTDPEDEALLFKDVMGKIRGEYIIYIFPFQVYPKDFLARVFRAQEEEKTPIASERAPYKERLLKAVQQSKYGMGVLKKDIKREYPELRLSEAYQLADFQKLQFLQLQIDENLAKTWQEMAKKKSIETKKYVPDYTAIEYFNQLKEYREAVRKDAQSWAFRNKPNTTGLPFYMLLFMVMSVLISPFIITAIFPLLVVSILYLLAITLESLAISTIKRQNDLLLGMLVFFPLLHIYYLWSSVVRFKV